MALVFAKPCELGLEGIVSKTLRQPLLERTGQQWPKCKNPAFVRT
jgi:hypothetical protein